MTESQKKPGGEAEKNKPPRLDPVLRFVLLWGGGTVAVLTLLVLIVVWLTFSPRREFSAPRLDEPHYLFLRRLATEVRKNRELKEATLRLPPGDVQLLLDIIRHSSQFARGRKELPPPEHFALEYRKGGGIYFAVPLEVAGKWCFGGIVYVSGELFFEKHEQKVAIELPDLRFGRFDLPVPGGLDLWFPSWHDRAQRALPGEFMKAVKSIYPEPDGTVVVVYRPRELRKPLRKQLDRVHGRCSAELRLPLEQLKNAL